MRITATEAMRKRKKTKVADLEEKLTNLIDLNEELAVESTREEAMAVTAESTREEIMAVIAESTKEGNMAKKRSAKRKNVTNPRGDAQNKVNWSYLL